LGISEFKYQISDFGFQISESRGVAKLAARHFVNIPQDPPAGHDW